MPGRYRDAYRLLIELSRTPWARLVVDTIAERLHVQGFRSGAPATDAEAWRLFQASSMNADERLVYTEALVTGVGYVSVAGGGTIAPESVFEVAHEPAPGNRRQVAAAIKVYPLEPTLREWAAELYRPDATYRWTAALTEPLEAGGFVLDAADTHAARVAGRRRRREPARRRADRAVREPRDDPRRRRVRARGLHPAPTPHRQNHARPACSRPTSPRSGRKWATGLDVPKDPDTGKPVEPFKAAVDRLWVSDNPDTKFGTFEASDLGQYLKAKDAEIAALGRNLARAGALPHAIQPRQPADRRVARR